MSRNSRCKILGYANSTFSLSTSRQVTRLSPNPLKLNARSVTLSYHPFSLSSEYNARNIAANMQKRSQAPGAWGRAKRNKEGLERRKVIDGTPKQILNLEARTLLADVRAAGDGHDRNGETEDGEGHARHRDRDSSRSTRPESQTELELEIQGLSSSGDGLAYSPGKDKDFVYVVPFSVPGDKVLAKIFPQRPESPLWTKVDFIKLLSPSPKREGVIPKCPYFGTCSGCQLQMLPYQEQLAHKKTIIEKAFKHFSNLDPSLIPPVDDTIGSPLQYGYRTKLTPHYNGGPSSHPWEKGDPPPSFGFTEKNQPKIVDIEQCPIGTEILNEGLKIERNRVAETFWQSKMGKTVLLRESTTREILDPSAGEGDGSKKSTGMPAALDILREMEDEADVDGRNLEATPLPSSLTSLPLSYAGTPASKAITFPSPSTPEITYTYPQLNFRETKTYSSDNKAITTEHVGPYTFATLANSFFQNNNSILPEFLAYIKQNLFAAQTSQAKNTAHGKAKSMVADGGALKIKYLLDAYCGSGLFSIALAADFSSVLGIDIDSFSIQCARDNAKVNFDNLHSGGNTGFIAADALAIFTDVPFPPAQTLCIIDPPRKGASRDFLQQLCAYGPKRVVYVSCNVHTQARDVGMLVQGFDHSGRSRSPNARDRDAGGEKKGWRYEIEKLGGFDFFPQTGHAEGVCFLNRVERDE